MKNLSIFALILVFIANTFVSMVWADSCLPGENQDMSQQVSMSGEMPCHDKQVHEIQGQDNHHSKQNPAQHCDDCSCLHGLSGQTLIIDANDLSFPIAHTNYYLTRSNSLVSVTQTPLYRPPIFIS